MHIDYACYRIAQRVHTRWAAYRESPRANRHIWFLPTRKPTLKNQKSLFCCQRSDRKDEI